MGQSKSTSQNITVQWEWQSNPNPWSSEPKQWTPYGPKDNDILEKAYKSKKEKIELDDYVVFIKSREMRQQRKNDAFKARRVRRNKEYGRTDEELNANLGEKALRKRFSGIEVPKTYNNTFGSLEHFLLFFENRGPEIKKFAAIYREIELNQDMNKLSQEILPLLISSIKEEAARSKNNKGEKDLIKIFEQKVFADLRQFYGDVLKAYTIGGFLYTNMNRYLRNEDWSELDCLLPYAFCLCKAFLQPELASVTSTFNNQQPNNEGQDSQITLYRGTRFDEATLSSYNPSKLSIFSWNGVTSTSTNRKIAENFMNFHIDSKKIPVMFVIETPLSPDELKSLKWIDIKPFSIFPTEEEIVLGPGSTFNLVSFHKDQKGAEIHLKLVASVKSLAQQGQIMIGAMQAEMAMGKVMKIGCLDGKELEEAITHLKGNKLVEELELIGVFLDANTMAKLTATLSTLANLKRLVCVSVTSEDKKHLATMLEAIGKLKISTLEICDVSLEDEQIMSPFANKIRSFASLTTLYLNFEYCKEITDAGLARLCSEEGIRCLTLLTALTLKFPWCKEITDEGITSLGQGIKPLTALKTLSLNFESCSGITDTGISNLCSQGLQYLLSLTTLKVTFELCSEIKDEGLGSFGSEGLGNLTALTTLDLNFTWCNGITDRGLHRLCEGIGKLTLLTTLRLDFGLCKQITDEGIIGLWSEGIKHLTSLKILTLGFRGCEKITNEGIAILCSEGVRPMTSITTLTLNFEWCKQITGEGLISLCFQGLRNLSSLKTFNLFFESLGYLRRTKMWQDLEFEADSLGVALCINKKISRQSIEVNRPGTLRFKREINSNNNNNDSMDDVDITYNMDEIIISATDILSINSHEELELFYTQSADSSQLVKALTIKKSAFPKDITSQDLIRFSKGIRHLASLTALSIDFQKCDQTTDKWMACLGSEVIKHLTSLKTLSLDFAECKNLTDEGITELCSEGIRHLTSLTNLSLNFGKCQITDKGIASLCSKGIRHLTSLTTLTLCFQVCPGVSPQGLRQLIFLLKYFGFHCETS